MRISSNNFLKYFSIALFAFYLVVGLIIYKDFGITTDEEFQRYSGFFWLKYVLSFTPFEELKILADQKLNSIGGLTLPNPIDFPFYGVIYDLPLALFEILLGIEKSKDYFALRHLCNFLIFFISSIYFFFLLRDRFKNYQIPFFGVLFYISSPRVFGDSFFNNKDAIFLSLITISLFYSFKILQKFNYKNIFYFALFSALATSSRVLGIFLPISIVGIIFFEMLDKKLNINLILKFSLLLISYFLLTIIFWPYLWSDPFINFLKAYSIFSNYIIDIEFLFNGDYVSSKNLPYSYLPIWISISTPIIVILLFCFGYFLYSRIFFSRLINLEKNIDNNIWSNKEEKKDFFIFFNISGILIYLILSKTILYNGWRQVYFLHVFLVYFSSYGLNILLENFRLLKKIKILIYFFISVFLLNIGFEIYKTHPYQSLYFNNFVKKNTHGRFEVDYWGLSGKSFFIKILNLEKNGVVNIGVASWVPIQRSLALFDDQIKKRINVVGQDFEKADYIFSNNITEVNSAVNKKYEIPKNFQKIDELVIKNILVYEVYKRNN
tara:strand:+ start:209 stop:1858 length:1650 start_codon:yes stop_codon:yes gene_type:complete